MDLPEKSIFEKIADRELPSYIVWEDDQFLAFLTIGPIAEGHTLVIPKKNWGDNVFHLTNQEYLELMQAAKKVAALLEEKLEPLRVIMWTEGFEVPHVHVHLVPVQEPPQLLEGKIKDFSTEEYEKTMEKITK